MSTTIPKLNKKTKKNQRAVDPKTTMMKLTKKKKGKKKMVVVDQKKMKKEITVRKRTAIPKRTKLTIRTATSMLKMKDPMMTMVPKPRQKKTIHMTTLREMNKTTMTVEQGSLRNSLIKLTCFLRKLLTFRYFGRKEHIGSI